MAEQQQEQDRSEQATPFKLQEARKRGQVAKSLEINSLLILSIVLVILYFSGERLISGQLDISRRLFEDIHRLVITPTELVYWFREIVGALISLYWPFVGALMVVGILANMFQVGPVFSFFPLKPDVNRLNPISGFKRVFSIKLLFESVKTAIKLVVFGAIIYLAIVAIVPVLLGLIDTDPKVYPLFLLENGRALIYKLLLVFVLLALMDLLYTRWDYNKRMRMSRREVKEEFKRREGDPQIRARIRELQKEAVKRAGSLRKVPDADVLITNPVHLAVALKYQRETMAAPQVIAKGAGELAARMRKVARRHGVTIVENKHLARVLFRHASLDAAIPEPQYPLVAKIMAWVLLQQQGVHKQASYG